MARDIIERLSESAFELSLHSEDAYYLEGFIHCFSDADKRKLFRFVIEQTRAHADIATDEYLYLTYGVLDETELKDKHFGQLLSELYLNYGLEAIREKDVANVLAKPERALEQPSFCAEILSRRSFHEVSLSKVASTAKEVAFDAKDSPQINETPGIDDIADDFWFHFSGPGREGLERAWAQYGRFLERVRVEKRHPLYATNYALLLSEEERNLLYDPIEELIREAAHNPSIIHRLTPRDFERFIAQIFEGFGFSVELTAATRDDGADIVCMSYTHGIPFKLAIEAKRYSPHRPVSVDLVRSFVGANELIRANKLLFVTTSRFTRDARTYATSNFLTNLLELKDLPDIQRWADEYTITRVRGLQLPKGFLG